MGFRTGDLVFVWTNAWGAFAACEKCRREAEGVFRKTGINVAVFLAHADAVSPSAAAERRYERGRQAVILMTGTAPPIFRDAARATLRARRTP